MTIMRLTFSHHSAALKSSNYKEKYNVIDNAKLKFIVSTHFILFLLYFSNTIIREFKFYIDTC